MLKCAVCWLSLKVNFCLFLIVFTYKITEYCVYRKPSEPLHWKTQVESHWNDVSHIMFACSFFLKQSTTSVTRTEGEKIFQRHESNSCLEFLPAVYPSIMTAGWIWVDINLNINASRFTFSLSIFGLLSHLANRLYFCKWFLLLHRTQSEYSFSWNLRFKIRWGFF